MSLSPPSSPRLNRETLTLSGHPAGLPTVPGLKQLYFENTRMHGLIFEGTRVVQATNQARKLGVRPGWRVLMVDGSSVRSSEEIWLRLQEAKWQWRSCVIWFLKDAESIKADEADAHNKAVEEEVLPVESPYEYRHLVMLVDNFPFQGYIEGAENRGISFRQLKRVVRWVEEQCPRWHDLGPPSVSSAAGQALSLDILNLYHVNDWLIKPSTKSKRCSFVENIVSKPQPPNYFVSHWWGEPVADFFRCVTLHASTRGFTETAIYWICAYANRQHCLDEDIHEDPKQSSFFHALFAAEFKTLLILNEANTDLGIEAAMPFSRLWCAFEETLCLEQPSAPLDVATTHRKKAMLLTSGLTEREEMQERENPGFGCKAKSERERMFPLTVAELGLAFAVQRAQASMLCDKTRILNTIAQRALDLPELEENPKYDEANLKLRSWFAQAFYRRVLADGGGPATRALQERLSDAIRRDEWRTVLSLSLAGCENAGDAEASALLKGISPNVRELHLDIRGLRLSDEALGDLASNLPNCIESANVDLGSCPNISSAGIANFRSCLPPNIKSVSLGLANTSVSADIQAKCRTLEGLLDANLEQGLEAQSEASFQMSAPVAKKGSKAVKKK